jgi:hypothetical protein
MEDVNAVSPHSHERRVRLRKTGMRRKPGTQELVSSGDDERNGYCTNAALGKPPADGEESKAVEARVIRYGVTQEEYRVVSETRLRCGGLTREEFEVRTGPKPVGVS